MKKLTKLLLILGFSTVMTATTALSQPFPGETWTFDEQGLGLFAGPVVGYSIGYLSIEPISGFNILTYNLGYTPVTPGDVLMLEPNQQPSDLLRFDGQGHLYFFSRLEPGDVPNMADVPALPPTTGVPAVVPEINGEANWIPGPGQAGASPIVPGITYHLISVPEPGSASLLLGALGVGAIRRRARSLAD